MYGRVIVNKSELKFKEFDVYRSYYCGLCRSLKKNGFSKAFCLTYDMTFLSMLLNSLYETKTHVCQRRCVCHVCKKHSETTHFYSDYVADMSILLAYYKCLDDFHDDKNIVKLLCSLYLKPTVKRIEKTYSEKCSEIKNLLHELSAIEKTASIEECANIFGKITGLIFTPEDDLWKDILSAFGFYMGKFIYIADAYEDIEDDMRKNRPNPLKVMYQSPDFDHECKTILNMFAAEAANEFEKLPIIENAEILRNVIYSGIWQKIEGVKE